MLIRFQRAREDARLSAAERQRVEETRPDTTGVNMHAGQAWEPDVEP